ncbi:hypothetical protein E2562_030793 [Oryza meyeriana var. granulata]|uniref:Uncharacterized protein n=1 Tax=Oryza meyeriana var. granulata TaxID=110450 RepID=A0A6G1CAD1_9ORYZ|nr:hypothetical protein E2562_030793 [Oryza meyeriana var. granulata]
MAIEHGPRHPLSPSSHRPCSAVSIILKSHWLLPPPRLSGPDVPMPVACHRPAPRVSFASLASSHPQPPPSFSRRLPHAEAFEQLLDQSTARLSSDQQSANPPRLLLARLSIAPSPSPRLQHAAALYPLRNKAEAASTIPNKAEAAARALLRCRQDSTPAPPPDAKALEPPPSSSASAHHRSAVCSQAVGPDPVPSLPPSSTLGLPS